MRFLLLLLAAAGTAAAQTPKPAKPLVKPKAAEAPRAHTVPAPLSWHNQTPMTGLFDLAPLATTLTPSWDFPSLAPLADVTWDLAPLTWDMAPMAWDMTPLPSPSWDFDVTPHLAMDLMPTTPMAAMPLRWGDDLEGRGTFSRMKPDQGTPEDSLYRAAREALNRGEYSRASTMFKSLEQKYPRSRIAPAVLYYQAFALYRSGTTDELERALTVLQAQQERYPESAADPDALNLRTRLQAALAARGNAKAAAELQAATAGGAQSCDREDIEVRAEALNALSQLNPAETRPTLKKVLSRRDECSVQLRRRAVYILGRLGTDEATNDLLEVAKTDPDASVKSDAILLLGRSAGTATIKTLETLFAESSDDRTRQAVLSALRSRGDPEAKRVLRTIIERNDVPERMRMEAISQLAGSSAEARAARWEVTTAGGQNQNAVKKPPAADDEDAAYLRGQYAKQESQQMKLQIISAVARIGGTASDQWLLGIAKNRDEDMRLRREALARLRSTSLTVDDLGKLLDSISERELRSAIVYQLAVRDEPAAADKLIEIVKSGTDPQIRREAINALSRKKDPRTTKLLLDLVEKP